jgi:hypothetical protein
MLSLEMNTVDVHLETSTCGEPLPTLAAGVVADFLVHRQDMLFEISFLTKFCTAGGTLEHKDSLVHGQDMLFEMSFPTKFCTAGRTLELPYFIMYSLHMQVNVTLAGEFSLASLALKLFLFVRLLLNIFTFDIALPLVVPFFISAVHPMSSQQTAAGKAQAASGTQMDISCPVLLSTESVQALKKR